MFGGNTRGRGRGGSNSRDRTRGGGNRSGSSDSKSSNLSVVDQARIAREERAKAAERGKQVRQLQAVVRGFNTRNAVGRRLRAEVDKKLGDIERLGTLLAQQAAKAAEKKRAEAVMAAAASGRTMKPPAAAPVATGMRVPLPIAADVCRKLIVGTFIIQPDRYCSSSSSSNNWLLASAADCVRLEKLCRLVLLPLLCPPLTSSTSPSAPTPATLDQAEASHFGSYLASERVMPTRASLLLLLLRALRAAILGLSQNKGTRGAGGSAGAAAALLCDSAQAAFFDTLEALLVGSSADAIKAAAAAAAAVRAVGLPPAQQEEQQRQIIHLSRGWRALSPGRCKSDPDLAAAPASVGLGPTSVRAALR